MLCCCTNVCNSRYLWSSCVMHRLVEAGNDCSKQVNGLCLEGTQEPTASTYQYQHACSQTSNTDIVTMYTRECTWFQYCNQVSVLGATTNESQHNMKGSLSIDMCVTICTASIMQRLLVQGSQLSTHQCHQGGRWKDYRFNIPWLYKLCVCKCTLCYSCV